MATCLRCLHDETEHAEGTTRVLVGNKWKTRSRECNFRNCKCRSLLIPEILE